jgi:hypothetical protein
MRRAYRLSYSASCGLFAIACFWFALGAVRGGVTGWVLYIVVMVLAALLFASTALAVWGNWRHSDRLAGVSGGLLVLYALSVVLLGWEDVGGTPVAILLSLVIGLAGCLGLVVCFANGGERGAA